MDMGAGGWLNDSQAGPSGIIMVNSDLSGTYITHDRGKSWTNIGAVQGLKETHACGMGYDPVDSKVIFIGMERGIYRSSDGGYNFVKVFDGIFCTDIVISKSNHMIGFAGGNSRYNKSDGNVYKTTDNGETWTKVSTDLPASDIVVQEIIVSPANPDILYAQSYKGRFAKATSALYKSVNGGANWTEVAPEILRNEIFDIAIDPSDFNRMYATGKNIGIAKSVDGGITWVTKKLNEMGSIHIKSDKPNIIRVLCASKCMESSDYGDTWVLKAEWPETSFLPGHSWGGVDMTRKCDDMSNSDTYFWRNSCWVWGSFDGGKTIHPLWTKEASAGAGWWITTGVENSNPWTLEISEADPNLIYVGYWDMGMWRSLDHGQSWQSCNNTDLTGKWTSTVSLNSKQGCGGNCRTICADPKRTGVVWATIGGDQGEPELVYKSSNFGKFDSWEKTTGLPATKEVFGLSVDHNSPLNNRILFVTANGNIYKSTNDGIKWDTISSGLNCQFTMVDRFKSGFVYAGGKGGFYRSVDSGSSWTKTGLPEMTNIYDIKSDLSDKGWIYAVCFGRGLGLYLSKDWGITWEKILTDDFLRGIAVDPKNPNNLYAAASSARDAGGYNPNSHGVLFTRDGGKTWKQANEGLSWPFAWCLAVDPKDPSFIFGGFTGQNCKKRQFSDVK
jgi:photosystem II stability/assembly factor-like uncharacterized protein